MDSLPIIYHDNYLVAINKPSGLLVHRSNIDRHETRFAVQMLRDQLQQYVYPVHRLDKPTSGVLLFGLSPEIAKTLSDAFAHRKVSKTYLAVVRGYADGEGIIDHPLKEKLDKMTDRLSRADKPAQSAVTRYQRLATAEIPYEIDRYPQSRYSLVKAFPETGRKHQIRRHLKHIGHPIIGDAKHGKGVHNRFFNSHFNSHRLLLACIQLQLQHPVSDELLTLDADLDTDFQSVIDGLGWSAIALN